MYDILSRTTAKLGEHWISANSSEGTQSAEKTRKNDDSTEVSGTPTAEADLDIIMETD